MLTDRRSGPSNVPKRNVDATDDPNEPKQVELYLMGQQSKRKGGIGEGIMILTNYKNFLLTVGMIRFEMTMLPVEL